MQLGITGLVELARKGWAFKRNMAGGSWDHNPMETPTMESLNRWLGRVTSRAIKLGGTSA